MFMVFLLLLRQGVEGFPVQFEAIHEAEDDDAQRHVDGSEQEGSVVELEMLHHHSPYEERPGDSSKGPQGAVPVANHQLRHFQIVKS